MNWIFESLLLPKDDAAPGACEDRIVMLPPDFAVVIDGATDISGQRFGGQTGGALAAEAIAAAFAAAWSDARRGGPDPFATARDALALADRSIAALYGQLGLRDVVQDPARRFRAAFAVASLRDGMWRGVGVGDCALRINDQALLARDHPAERVFAAWRAAIIAANPDLHETAIRAALVGGLTRADALARRAAERIASPDPVFAQQVLTAGLGGMRAAVPGDPLAFGVADGVGDMAEMFCWQTQIGAVDVWAFALWTDGWLSPGRQTIRDWRDAAAAVHMADPRRTGTHSCVKGPTVSGRHDDMALVLVRSAERMDDQDRRT